MIFYIYQNNHEIQNSENCGLLLEGNCSAWNWKVLGNKFFTWLKRLLLWLLSLFTYKRKRQILESSNNFYMQFPSDVPNISPYTLNPRGDQEEDRCLYQSPALFGPSILLMWNSINMPLYTPNNYSWYSKNQKREWFLVFWFNRSWTNDQTSDIINN